MRQAALQKVDEDLVSAGLIDKVGGQLSRLAAAELSFERTTCLPTPAIVIKGCLDDCIVCEDTCSTRSNSIWSERRWRTSYWRVRIELLEKSQEYRSCPADAVEDEAGDG